MTPESVRPTVLSLFVDDKQDALPTFAELMQAMFAVRMPRPDETIEVRPVDGFGDDVYAIYYDERREAA